jgi:hypothetical protein
LEVCDNIFVGFSKCKGTSAMARHLKYTEAVRQLAGRARQNAMDRDALYHGTRFAELILKTGVLFYSDPGQPKVSFTRSPEVAAYWALLERDYEYNASRSIAFWRAIPANCRAAFVYFK